MTAFSSPDQQTKAVPAQSYLRSLLPRRAGGAEGWKECCREAGMFPGSQKTPKFLSGVFYFQETHWNEPWTRTGLLPGEHLRVRHTALIFPPSTISNGHREPSPCTSEKALHWQACLKQEALQPLASNHLNDPCMPRPWLTILAEKKIHQHLWLHRLFHPQCRRHRKTATNSTSSKGCVQIVFWGVIRQGNVQRSSCTTWPS